jgi:hypothetical protein
MVISPDDIVEKYKQGIVNLDDATDYFYKRLYPRRYRFLKWAAQRVAQYRSLCRRGFNEYTWASLVGRLPSAAVAWILLPFFTLHYRRASQRLADMVRADRQPRLHR